MGGKGTSLIVSVSGDDYSMVGHSEVATRIESSCTEQNSFFVHLGSSPGDTESSNRLNSFITQLSDLTLRLVSLKVLRSE